jgi:hypothetical protein
VLMIGEKAADLVRGVRGLRPAAAPNH